MANPNSLAIQLISRICVIAFFWGVAWVAGWLTRWSIAFYLIGSLGTIAGIHGIIREIRFQRNYKPY